MGNFIEVGDDIILNLSNVECFCLEGVTTGVWYVKAVMNSGREYRISEILEHDEALKELTDFQLMELSRDS